MKRRTLAVTMVILVTLAGCGVASIYAYLVHRKLEKLEMQCRQIAHWAKGQSFSVGAHEVPASLVGATSGVGVVNLVKTKSGDIVVLLKTSIGWKGNYSGVLYSTRPLFGEDIGMYYGRPAITVSGIDATPPAIRRQLSPQFFVVYVDLG